MRDVLRAMGIAAALMTGSQTLVAQSACTLVPDEVKLVMPAALAPGRVAYALDEQTLLLTCPYGTDQYSGRVINHSVDLYGSVDGLRVVLTATSLEYAEGESTQAGTLQVIAPGLDATIPASVIRTSRPFIRFSPPLVELFIGPYSVPTGEISVWFPNARSPMAFTAAADSSSPWLSATPAGGAGFQSLQIAADAGKLAAGRYYGVIVVDAPGAVNSPVNIPVALEVQPVASVSLGPDHLFEAPANRLAPAPRTVHVIGTPVGMHVALSSDSSWLSVSPTGGSLPFDVSIAVDQSGLKPGTYTGKITARFGVYSTQMTVTLKVS